jgi:hypothetical protein
MKEQHCPNCASPGIRRARDIGFTVVSRCLHCGELFADALSVVLVDGEHARRARLVSLLRANDIRVIPASRVADLERWPIGEVLVTDATHATRWWIDVGATHVIVLADTDEERSLAQRTGASAMVGSRNPVALLSILRAFVQAGLLSGSDTIQ